MLKIRKTKEYIIIENANEIANLSDVQAGRLIREIFKASQDVGIYKDFFVLLPTI